jgi:glycerophosphoryl diester phosphodiesterase
MVIAHRGASAYAPENTLPAFERAAQLGADAFELDVQLTKEDKIIVFHDADLERYTGVKRAVGATPFDEMRAVDAGAPFGAQWKGVHPPTLDEALDLARKRDVGILIEIKRTDADKKLHGQLAQALIGHDQMTPELAKTIDDLIAASHSRNITLTEQTVEAVRRHRMGKHIVIQSFSPVVCWLAQRLAPELRVEFLGMSDKDDPNRWELYVNWGRITGVKGFNVNLEDLTPERVAMFHSWGASVAAWTVDDPERMRALIAMGVDGFISNKPDVVREVVGEKRARFPHR